jgi:hypothetical protein
MVEDVSRIQMGWLDLTLIQALSIYIPGPPATGLIILYVYISSSACLLPRYIPLVWFLFSSGKS